MAPGDKGKHEFPGNRGYLSNTVAKFDFIMLSSSANMQPTDQMSMADVYTS